MRKPILAGNWKMNLTIAESIDFVRSIRRGLNDVRGVDRVLCPPFTALATLKDLLSATEIGLGAQKGTLAEGLDADIVVLNEELGVEMTMVGGAVAWQRG